MNLKRLAGMCGLVIAASFGARGQEKAAASDGPPLTAEVLPACYQDNRYHLAADFPGVLIFTFKGDPTRVKEAWIAMDLPPGVELIGVSTFYPTKHENNTDSWEADSIVAYGNIKRENKDYSRSVVTVNAPMLKGLRPEGLLWGNHERVYIKASPTLAGKTFKMYWRTLTREGEGPQQSVDLSILPPLELPAQKAKRFQLMVCMLGQASAPFPAVREAYFRYWLSLAQRPYTFGAGGVRFASDDLRERIARDFRYVAIIPGGESLRLGGGSRLGIPPRVYADDTKPEKKRPGHICPSFLCDNPPDSIFWKETAPLALRDSISKNMPKPEAFVLDFEPMFPTEHCFCEVCRKGFAAFAKLAAVPDSMEIKAKHSKAWFEFRVQQHATINARFAGMVRKHFWPAKYWVCTDPLHDGRQMITEWCGCDERLFDPDVDVHQPMTYCAGLKLYKDVALNVRTLKKPVFPVFDPAERMLAYYSRYSPLKVKQNILACAVHGAMGVGFWPEDHLDGAYLVSIAHGMGLVARMEDYYFAKRDDSLAEVEPEPITEKTAENGGKKSSTAIPSFGENIQYAVHQKDQSRLITVFNFNEKTDAILRLKAPGLPPGEYRVRDVESGRVYLDAERKPLDVETITNGFLSKVKAGDVLLLEVTPNNIKNGGISQAEFKNEIEAARSSLETPRH